MSHAALAQKAADAGAYFPAMSEEEGTLYRSIGAEASSGAQPANSGEDESGPKAQVSGGVLDAKTISKPAPVYPQETHVRAAGEVKVRVVIDETGRVISAKALSGHPLLQAAAVAAARKAVFAPTLLKGKPVKVAGTLTYRFEQK